MYNKRIRLVVDKNIYVTKITKLYLVEKNNKFQICTSYMAWKIILKFKYALCIGQI